MSSTMEEEITVESLAPSKLLNYVRKDALVGFLTQQKNAEVEQRLRSSLGKSRINLKDMKKFLATKPDFIAALRKSQTGARAMDKYNQAVGRLRSIDRSKAAATRKVMSEPRRQFTGCLATRLKETDYQHCLDNYDQNEDYAAIELVPSALTQRGVHDRGDQATKDVLRTGLQAQMCQPVCGVGN